MKYDPKSRRMFLQGSGGLFLAIPFLSSIVPREARGAANQNSPLRFVAVTNGQSPNEITFFGKPRASTDPFNIQQGNLLSPTVKTRTLTDIQGEVSFILGPLSHLKSNFTVIRGLDVYAFDGGAHPGSFPLAATGFNSGNGDFLNSKQDSIDSLIARLISDQSILKARRHMVLSPYLYGIDELGLPTGSGASSSYQKNPADPVHATMRINALGSTNEILARFFGVGVQAPQAVVSRRNLLDAVLGDFQRIRSLASISSEDKSKLDKYVAVLHDIEGDIDKPLGTPLRTPALETELSPQILARRSGESDQSLYERQRTVTLDWLSKNKSAASELRARNQMRLIAAAFALDSTRVASIKLGNGSHTTHHSSNMHQRNETSSVEMADFCEAHRRNARSIAFLMDCLSDLSDSNGANLLDQSLIYWNQQYGSVRTSGGGHSRSNFPIVVAGGAASKIKFNQYIDYEFKNALGSRFGIPLNNLLVTIMNSFGLGSDQYETVKGGGYGSYDAAGISELPAGSTSTAGRRLVLPGLFTGQPLG